MSIGDKFNKVLETDPRDRSEPKYPDIYGESSLAGRKLIRYEPREAKDQAKAFVEEVHHDGTFTNKEANGLLNSLIKQCREYVCGGKSVHSDGNNSVKSGSNVVVDADLDTGQSTGGNLYKGQGGKEIGGAKEGSYSGTDGDTFKTTKGNEVKTHKGNKHSSTDGDHIATVIGTHYHTVVGEHGINVQKGNFDTLINDGKLKFDVAKNISIVSHDQINLNADAGVGIINLQGLNKIILQLAGDSGPQIIMDATSIILKVGTGDAAKGIKITSDGVSITKTTWVGQDKIGEQTGTASPKAHFP